MTINFYISLAKSVFFISIGGFLSLVIFPIEQRTTAFLVENSADITSETLEVAAIEEAVQAMKGRINLGSTEALVCEKSANAPKTQGVFYQNKEQGVIPTQNNELTNEIATLKEQLAFETLLSTFMNQGAIGNFQQNAKRFEADVQYYEQAYEQEAELLSLFSNNEQLAMFSVEQSECKAEQCRLAISPLNQQELAQLSDSLSTSFFEHPKLSGKAYMMMAGEDGTTHIYIGKQADILQKNDMSDAPE